MKRLILLLAISYACVVAYGQSNFTGKIDYEITYLEIPETLEGYESMLPNTMSQFIKTSKMRMEIPSLMGNQIVLLDKESNSVWMLMDMVGTKMAIDISPKELEEPSATEKITYYKEKKEIAGYTCHKAIVTVIADDSTKTETEVWYTNKIPNITQHYSDLKGLALSYTTTDESGIVQRITATNVSEQRISNSLFEVPDDYEKSTLQELNEMYQ